MLEQDNISRIKILLKAHPRGLTITDVSQNLKMNRNSAAKYLEILQISGIVESRAYGTARVFFLTHRLPISALVSITEDLVVTLNENHKILFVNESFCTFFEVKKEDAAGTHIVEIFKNGIGRKVLPDIFSDIIAGDVKVHDVQFSRDAGDVFFKIKSMPTVFDDGSRGITIVMVDVTRETQDKIELETKEARYRGIVEDQTDYVVRFLPDGTLTFVNTAYSLSLKKRSEDLVGTPFPDAIHPEDQRLFDQVLRSLGRENPVAVFVGRSAVPENPVRWVAWTLRVLYDHQKEPREYQAVGHDITRERTEKEHLNLQLTQMEFFSAKLQQFIELPPDADIYQVIATGFSEILPVAAVCVSGYDPETRLLSIKAIASKHDQETFTRQIGRDIVGLAVPVDPGPIPHVLLDGKILNRSENLFTLFRGGVPEQTCFGIEEMLNLGDYYSVGLSWQGTLLGSVTFSVRKGGKLENVPLAETYIRAASIALQRSRAEDALRESERLYRSVLDNIQDVYYRADMEGNLLMVSPSGATMLGYSSPAEARGVNIGRDLYLEPEKRDDLTAAITKYGSVSNYEVVLKKKDGTPFYIETNSHLYYDKDGTLRGIEGIFRDITERKAATQKIHQYIGDMEFLSQKLLEFITMDPAENIYDKILVDLKTLVPGSTILVNSFDPHTGTVTIRSAAMTEKREEAVFRALGRDLVGCEFPIDEMGRSAFQTGLLQKGEISLFEIAFRSIPKPVCDQLEAELDLGEKYAIGFVRRGEIMGNAALFLDRGLTLPDTRMIQMYAREAAIAIRHFLSQSSLAESERRYRTVLENIQDVFYRSDINGNLIMASPSWARILGYTSLDECLGKSIAKDFWMEPEKRVVFLREVLSKGFVTDYNVVLKKKDGTPLYVSVNSHVYSDTKSTVLGVEGTFRDISEQRAAREKIARQAAEREFLLKNLLDFMAMEHGENIYQRIADTLETIVPGSVIAVNSFDPKTGLITIRGTSMSPLQREIVLRALGRDPAGITLPSGGRALEQMRMGHVVNANLSLHAIGFGALPAPVCSQLETELRLGDNYLIGFVRNGEIMGDAVILLEHGQAIADLELLEMYAGQAAIALQRSIAEEERRKSDELFFNFAQNSPLPMALLNEDDTFQDINESFSQLFGYDLNDFHTLKEWFCLIFPDPVYRQQILEGLELDRSQAGPSLARVGSYPVRCKDSIVREVIARRIALSDGRMCVICEDITERNKAEQTHRLLSSIIASTSDAVIAKDPCGTIISWNKAAERLYGYSAEEMIGQNISRIIPPERAEETERIFSRVSCGESVSDLETRRIRKDGRFVDVSVTVSPIINDAGTVTGASTIARDITRHKAEERLRKDEEQYRSLVENISVGFYRSTGDPTGRFIWGNSSLVHILGYPSFEDLSRVGIADIFVDQDGRKRLLDDLKKDGFVKNRQIALRRVDGKTVSVLVTALARFDPGGDLSCINGIVQDITGQKQAEDHARTMDKQMQDILTCLSDPVVITDKENRVIAWNAAMELLTGKQKAEVDGRDDYEHLLPWYDPARPALFTLFDTPDRDLEQYYPGAYRQGSMIIVPIKNLVHQKGQPDFFSVRASPLRDPCGAMIGAVQVILTRSPDGSTRAS